MFSQKNPTFLSLFSHEANALSTFELSSFFPHYSVDHLPATRHYLIPQLTLQTSVMSPSASAVASSNRIIIGQQAWAELELSKLSQCNQVTKSLNLLALFSSLRRSNPKIIPIHSSLSLHDQVLLSLACFM